MWTVTRLPQWYTHPKYRWSSLKCPPLCPPRIPVQTIHPSSSLLLPLLTQITVPLSDTHPKYRESSLKIPVCPPLSLPGSLSQTYLKYPGFPPTLENLEKWDNFFQSGKSQGILKKCQKVREKSGNFKRVREKSGKTVIHQLKFNQLRIKILLNFFHWNYSKIPLFGQCKSHFMSGIGPKPVKCWIIRISWEYFWTKESKYSYFWVL